MPPESGSRAGTRRSFVQIDSDRLGIVTGCPDTGKITYGPNWPFLAGLAGSVDLADLCPRRPWCHTPRPMPHPAPGPYRGPEPCRQRSTAGLIHPRAWPPTLRD